MPKPRLIEPYGSLIPEIIETMTAGLHEWRPDLSYPESHSDWQACLMAFFRRYEVKRRPLDLITEKKCGEPLCAEHEEPFESEKSAPRNPHP